jgi:hypothetical protein
MAVPNAVVEKYHVRYLRRRSRWERKAMEKRITPKRPTARAGV